MILESFLSYEKELISREEYQEIKYVLKEIYPFIEFDKNDIEQIIKLLSFDKKNEYGKILFVLLDKIGNIKINQQINNESIFKAFEDYHL